MWWPSLEAERSRDDEGADPEYRTVGCGIRANRSTDRVATWWFSTDRRAKIDFRLTEAVVPFSADVLRTELGTRGQVFASAGEYRAEVARRFFGGADPRPYCRLLHQVRNPRVGDRVDTDLPRTLREALPPVPEDAVSDAAQPLEDLEDHRRNVIDLATAAEALDDVVEVYSDYARRVLMTVVEDAAPAAWRSSLASTRAGHGRTQGLVSLPEFSAHALVRRRDELGHLDDHTQTLDGYRERARERTAASATAVAATRGQLESDLAGVTEHLRAVATAARTASAPVRLPDPPALVSEARHDPAGATVVDVPEGLEGADSTDADLTAHLPGPLAGVADALRAHRASARALRDRAADDRGPGGARRGSAAGAVRRAAAPCG